MSSEFQLISKHQKQLNSLSGRIEPIQNSLQKAQSEVLEEQSFIWGQLLDSFLNVSIDFKFNINNIHSLLNTGNLDLGV